MSCQNEDPPGTFGYAFEKLQNIEGIEILQNGDAMIAVSGIYQGRIFTSSVNGINGKSYGWINWDLIEKNKHAENIAYLGGESRLWFGPDHGPFSLFHPPGVEQVGENIVPPHDLNNKKFREIKRTIHSLTYGSEMKIRNAADFKYHLSVERKVELLSENEMEQDLQIELPNNISHVAFSAETTVENIDEKQLKKETGLFSIWELGCMLTSPDNIVIIPLSDSTNSVTEYFTPVAKRIKIIDSIVFYKADALGMNKIGVPPEHCKNIMGSYSPSNQLLNIVTFSFENDSLYVNAVPENNTPYAGDVINIFNGEINLKKNWNWPFYEFESSSSAKELMPGEKIFHRQTTYHFEGNIEELNKIAASVLGVDLSKIPVF